MANYFYAIVNGINGIKWFGPYEAEVEDIRNFIKHAPKKVAFLRACIAHHCVWSWTRNSGWIRETSPFDEMSNSEVMKWLKKDFEDLGW